MSLEDFINDQYPQYTTFSSIAPAATIKLLIFSMGAVIYGVYYLTRPRLTNVTPLDPTTLAKVLVNTGKLVTFRMVFRIVKPS